MKNLIFIFLVMISFASASQTLEKVIIFTPDFSERYEITDQKKLKLIEVEWLAKKDLERLSSDSAIAQKFYKIDFFSSNRKINGRWLYLKTGYIRRLSKAPQKEYKIKDVQSFNHALGL